MSYPPRHPCHTHSRTTITILLVFAAAYCLSGISGIAIELSKVFDAITRDQQQSNNPIIIFEHHDDALPSYVKWPVFKFLYGPPISVTDCIQHQIPEKSAWSHLPADNLAHWAAHGFSQMGADGILHKIFADIGTTNKYFVEFGVESGIECNTRRLRKACGWSGLLMDGGFSDSALNLKREFITRENVVHLFRKYGVPQEPDLLSVDIDGNDFHVLAAILGRGRYRPRVIVVETNFYLLEDADVVMPYVPSHKSDYTCYQTASVLAYRTMARNFGYSIVLGMVPDLYWVRDDVLEQTVGLTGYQLTNNVSAILLQAKKKIHTNWTKLVACCMTIHEERGFINSTQAMAEAYHSKWAKGGDVQKKEHKRYNTIEQCGPETFFYFTQKLE